MTPHPQPQSEPAPEMLLALQRSAGNAAIARRLRVQRMAIAHAGKDHETKTMSDTALDELLQALPANELFGAASRASRTDADELIVRLSSAPGRPARAAALTVLKGQHFEARYLSALPANLQVPDHLSRRLTQMATLGAVEDYTNDVFARQDVAQRLTQISTGVAPGALRAAGERVCDMLLFTSLVATSGGGSAARAMQVLTPDALVAALDPAKLGGGAPLAPAVPSSKGPVDPRRAILQDMLRVNVMSLDASLGGEVARSVLFQSILASNVIDVVLLANTQHEEQNYMSSCSIAARDQEVLSRIGSIAGLIVLGKRVAARFIDDLASQKDRLSQNKSDVGANLYEHAFEEASNTAADIAQIEGAALELVWGGERNVAAYGELVARWGRAMQRISAVLRIPGEGRQSAALLSEKVIPGQWVLSALVMAVPVLVKAGVSGDFMAHLGGRTRPPSPSAYSTALGQAGMPVSGGASHDIGQKPKDEWSRVIGRLWAETFGRGAMPYSVPGHALVLKAVRSQGAQKFLLGDPKGASFDEYSLDEMATYLAANDIDMAFDPFA